ncbi:MAG: type II toxin-antitoxin system Phd/YefM family antitoxin [Luteolibacter sp.]
MKTMTVRDIRQKWPEAERSLSEEGEIVITRDGKPVARLLPLVEEVVAPRKRFDPEEHIRWLKEEWGDETFDSLTPLMESREERVLISESTLAAWAAEAEKERLAAQNLKADVKL